jgi:hypothetical protein
VLNAAGDPGLWRPLWSSRGEKGITSARAHAHAQSRAHLCAQVHHFSSLNIQCPTDKVALRQDSHLAEEQERLKRLQLPANIKAAHVALWDFSCRHSR